MDERPLYPIRHNWKEGRIEMTEPIAPERRGRHALDAQPARMDTYASLAVTAKLHGHLPGGLNNSTPDYHGRHHVRGEL